MTYRQTLGVALAIGCAASQAAAQHLDILAFNAGGQVAVGEFDFNTLSENERSVFTGRLDTFYSVNNPGFTARSGSTALPGNTDLEWDFLPMTVDSGLHDGYLSTLLYWDGVGTEPVFGPTPTDDYRFSLFGKNGPSAAGGTDQLVPGRVIETTSPNGSIHEHRFYFLDDNGDGMNTTLPDAGIYVIAMQLRMEGLETSDPFFMVWGTPESSITAAIQPAVDWVNDRVETLVVEESLLPGDYNLDGLVDAADYSAWRDAVGTPAGSLPNDIDGGVIGEDQYNTWAANYGRSTDSMAPNAAIPEPTALWLALLGSTVASQRRPKRG